MNAVVKTVNLRQLSSVSRSSSERSRRDTRQGVWDTRWVKLDTHRVELDLSSAAPDRQESSAAASAPIVI